MGVSMRHVLEQGAMLRMLGGAALTALRRPGGTKPTPALPGPWIASEVVSPSRALVRAFVKNAGGDPSLYKEIVPPHLFPQWALPLAFRVVAPAAPYPLTRVINAGCKLVQRAPLLAGERLILRARLESIDDDTRRAILTTRIVTGTANAPDALEAEIHALVPLARKQGARSNGKAPVLVPLYARELAFFRLGADAGFDFAKLTGDLNPIHWVPAYARASGFQSTILHGFGTFALAIETVVRRMLSGDVGALASADARFTRPLVLPARVGVYVSQEREIFVGNAPGAPAYLTGHWR
jgi:acyl dehydratase